MSFDWVRHSAYSDPGGSGALLDALPTDLAGVSAAARNVIVHYRGSGEQLPVHSRDDVNSRWLEQILAVDQSRHPQPLDISRPATQRVQGCCRDHTLFCVGALRQQGRSARSRVGFADYLSAGWHHDHVVVEVHDGQRWRRFDPELEHAGEAVPDPLDLDTGPAAPFQTAAEAYRLMRAGEIDPHRYGVGPTSPLRGTWFIEGYVVYEVAHRYGDELLLWDRWGAMPSPGNADAPELTTLFDGVAALLVAADAGDVAAETELELLYRSDPRLHPGAEIEQLSPYDDPPRTVSLRRRTPG